MIPRAGGAARSECDGLPFAAQAASTLRQPAKFNASSDRPWTASIVGPYFAPDQCSKSELPRTLPLSSSQTVPLMRSNTTSPGRTRPPLQPCYDNPPQSDGGSPPDRPVLMPPFDGTHRKPERRAARSGFLVCAGSQRPAAASASFPAHNGEIPCATACRLPGPTPLAQELENLEFERAASPNTNHYAAR